jgi:hypothetical protein
MSEPTRPAEEVIQDNEDQIHSAMREDQYDGAEQSEVDRVEAMREREMWRLSPENDEPA